MNKNIIVVASVTCVIIVSALISLKASRLSQNAPEKPLETSAETIHYHAGFQVYIDNKLQDYSGLEYMNFKPCSEDEYHTQLTPEEEQLEKAHLHDSIGDVVHVHRPNVVWGDLFTNISLEIDPNATAYINGELVENILEYPIRSYDSLVIFESESTNIEERLSLRVTKEHIVEAESRSELCGS